MKVFHVFLLVLAFGVVSSRGRTYENNAVRTPCRRIRSSPDEFILAQQWPASYCRAKVTRFHPRCRPHLNVPPYFTVHGLWAQWMGVYCNCRGRNSLNLKALSSKTVSGLVQYWPSLIKKNEEFWGHEYDKHGSCIRPFNLNPDHFFSSTLELARKYNVTKWLENEGIVPGVGRWYPISDIKKAISTDTVKPSLLCNQAYDGTFQLLEIRYCFDLHFNPQICQRPDEYCPQNEQSLISFP